MLNKTRCAITPFADSGKTLTAETVSQITGQWVLLASAVEEAMELKEKEVLVWCLSLTGGHDAGQFGAGSRAEPPHAHAWVELCVPAHLPHGAYALHSAGSTYQGTLVNLAYAEISILTDSLMSKFVGKVERDEAVKSLVENLRK